MVRLVAILVLWLATQRRASTELAAAGPPNTPNAGAPMAFKGNIPLGSRVDAELSPSHEAGGSALLAIACSANDGSHAEDSESAAPGGFAQCTITTSSDANGRLRVFVDLNHESDAAQLIVRINGEVRDDETIEGDTSWAYSIS